MVCVWRGLETAQVRVGGEGGGYYWIGRVVVVVIVAVAVAVQVVVVVQRPYRRG